jgi:hypothetical protein
VALPGSSITIEGWVLTAEQAAGRRNRITTVLAEPVGVPAEDGREQPSVRSGASASASPSTGNGRGDGST